MAAFSRTSVLGILRHLAAAGLLTLGDKGYHGAGEPAITPYKGRNKPESQKAANRGRAKLRDPRRTRHRPAQDLAHPPQTPLLPVEGRAARQGHPRPSNPRNRRMKRFTAWIRAVPGRETAGLLPVFFLGSWSSAAIVSVYAADGRT